MAYSKATLKSSGDKAKLKSSGDKASLVLNHSE
jgi:hypothetical protein